MAKKGLFTVAAAFAASPMGRRLIGQAKAYVQSPQGRAKINDLKNQVTQKRTGPGSTGQTGSTGR
ncbi:MAG TPA: hypothetical protein VGP36_12745 [Mycobacteriales bacterium]|nr:hypothetical protein [Mycobacteriales bacterium]